MNLGPTKIVLETKICFTLIVVAILPSIASIQDSSILIDNDTKIQEAVNNFKNKCKNTLSGIDFLFAQETDKNLRLNDPIDAELSRLLDLSAPYKRGARGNIEHPGISLPVSKRAWSLLHQHAEKALKNRIESLIKPLIIDLLTNRKSTKGVSKNCTRSLWKTLERAKAMDSWAVRILLSWSSFPLSGLLEGTYTNMDAPETCLNIPENEYIGHAHYCSIAYNPVLPERKPYSLLISKEPDELLKLFDRSNGGSGQKSMESTSDRDYFSDLLATAHYFHIFYLKWGTCWPIECTPFDVQLLAAVVGRQSMLMHGPIRCHSLYPDDYEYEDELEDDHTKEVEREGTGTEQFNVTVMEQSHDVYRTQIEQTKLVRRRKLIISTKNINDGIFIWKPHINIVQWVALVILGFLMTLIVSMTIIDLLLVKIPSLYGDFKARLSVNQSPLNSSEQGTRVITNISSQAYQEITDRATKQLPESESNAVIFADIKSKPSRQDEIELQAPTKLPIDLSQPSLPPKTNHSTKILREENGLVYTLMQIVEDCSILNNASHFFHVSRRQLETDILCLNGLRCVFMSWIILIHTMLYNDWSMFGRAMAVEKSLVSLVNQPIFSAAYLVDVFFMMSGLLTAYNCFEHIKVYKGRFRPIAFIVVRWLRLTPQMFIASLIYMILPILSDKINWYPITGEWADNCQKNWWLNLLQLQAFIRNDEMCIFVTWWISIDFYFQLLSIAIIWIFLSRGHSSGLFSMIGILSAHLVYQGMRHYMSSFPPNPLSTIPISGPMWTDMTVNFIWQPYSHSVPFLFGFYVGYLMSMKGKLIARYLTTRIAATFWIITFLSLVVHAYSTYWWLTGDANYTPLVSTTYHIIAPIIWTLCFCWLTIACHYGYGGFINDFLSMKSFIILGKASYMIYLTHFQVMFTLYGLQTLVMEPHDMMILYFVIGNIVLSVFYGCALCITFELPWLKIYKRLLKSL